MAAQHFRHCTSGPFAKNCPSFGSLGATFRIRIAKAMKIDAKAMKIDEKAMKIDEKALKIDAKTLKFSSLSII